MNSLKKQDNTLSTVRVTIQFQKENTAITLPRGLKNEALISEVFNLLEIENHNPINYELRLSDSFHSLVKSSSFLQDKDLLILSLKKKVCSNSRSLENNENVQKNPSTSFHHQNLKPVSSPRKCQRKKIQDIREDLEDFLGQLKPDVEKKWTIPIKKAKMNFPF